MVKVQAMKPGSSLRQSDYQPQTSQPRNGPNWRTIVKAVVIIVAIAVAIYVGKTVVIPAIAEWWAKTTAAVEAAAVSTAEIGVKAAKTSKFLTNAIWLAQGQAVSVGGAASSGVAAVNTVKTMLKPIEVIKIIFKAAGELNETSAVSVPFAAAGGGGFAW